MRKLLHVVSILMLVLVALHLASCLVGCAVDPTTGKKVFDPAQANQVLQTPAVQGLAHAVPFGLGDLAVAAVGAVLYGMTKKQDPTAAIAEVAKHAISSATGSLNADAAAAIPATPTAPKV